MRPHCVEGSPQLLALLLNGKFGFTLQRWVAASLERLTGLARHSVQRPWVPCDRSMTMASSLYPYLKLFGDIFCCLLVLHFVGGLVSLGLLPVSHFHIWQPTPTPSQTTCLVAGQHEGWCGSGHRPDWQPKGKSSKPGSLGPGTQALLGRQRGLIGNGHLQA